MVEVVGEDIESCVGHDLGNIAIAESLRAKGLNILGADTAPLGDNFPAECEGGLTLRISGDAATGIEDFLFGQSRVGAQIGVCRDTVIAGVGLPDGESDEFTRLGRERTFAQGSAEGQVSIRSCRRLSHGGDEIGNESQGFLHGCEDRLLLGRGGGFGNCRDM